MKELNFGLTAKELIKLQEVAKSACCEGGSEGDTG